MKWFVVIAIAALAVVLWLFVRRPKTAQLDSSLLVPKPLDNIDTTPDAPKSFGYKMSWLAIKTEDSDAVLDSLPVTDLQPANWQTGVTAAYSGHVFISPPCHGWTLVVSYQLPELPESGQADELSPLLADLSGKFSEAQYFGTHRVVGYHAWALFKNGQEIREFAYLGERGEFMADRGEQTDGEAELSYNYFDPEHPDAESDAYWQSEELCFPDEEHVMEVAGKWSLNPQALGNEEHVIEVAGKGRLNPQAGVDLNLPQGVGWIGTYKKP